MALQLDIDLGVKAQGPQGERGPQGIQGVAGKGFSISKTYPSVSAMNADLSSLGEGDFAMIASNPDDPDNAKLYVKQGDAMKEIANLSGAQSIQGPVGPKGDTGAQGPQGEAGKIYQPYIAEDGNMHAKLINPDGSEVGSTTI